MLGLVGYSMSCFAIAVLLTVIVHFFRPIRQNDSFPAWKWILGFVIAVGAIPYGYTEILTKMKGDGMVEPIKVALGDAGVDGDLLYYRIRYTDDQRASVIAVAEDKNVFGTYESAVFYVDLEKTKGSWEPTSYEVVNSYQRQKDATTFPPYW
ncbi:MAG: hypothetical protein KIT11_11210 [Fimbriimonadaceae bacterium]|nr:hypothetical protein [Fimbriimonadaceae bacterium]QYK55399.1 MAG: hypothetical protein KF733_10325 [Fimbriimonadaceae bacterium]